MKFNMLVSKCGTMFHTLRFSSRGERHLGCCTCNVLFLVPIKILPSYTCANTDLSNRLLEMWIQLLDDLWLLWGLMSRYTLVHTSLYDQASCTDPCAFGCLSTMDRDWETQEMLILEGGDDARYNFPDHKTVSVQILGHQFAKMNALFLDFRKSSSSGLRPVITHDRFLFLHRIDASQNITS